MKKIFVFSLAIASLILAGCNKETATPENGRDVRISASVPATKVYGAASGRFYWEKNDKLGVWTGSEVTPFTIGAGWDGMTYAEFEGTIPAGGSIGGDNSFVFYPYSDAVSFDGSTVTLPAGGGWGLNYLNKQIYLYSNETPEQNDNKITSFKFNHITAYFRVTIKNIAVSCKALYLETPYSNYMLNGGTFNTLTGVLSPEKCDWAFVKLPEHTSVLDSYLLEIPVIPGAYGDGVRFRICGCKDAAFGNEMEGCNFNAAITLNAKAGDFYVFPDITFPNEKSANDAGSGVNDGIEDPVVNVQDDGFWKVG